MKASTTMSGTTPNFNQWRQMDAIKVWQVAVLMLGYDPRALADVVVRNPVDPDDPCGVPLDTSWEEDALISALDAGTLSSAPLNATPADKDTKITVKSLVPWLGSKGYEDLADELDTPAPKSTGVDSSGTDHHMLATRKQLIDAFGSFTGMDMSWFDNLKDTPALKEARKFTGHGGRGQLAEPLFCPFAVLKWLTNPKRRKGRTLSEDTAWRMLESHFPVVHDRHFSADPRHA